MFETGMLLCLLLLEGGGANIFLLMQRENNTFKLELHNISNHKHLPAAVPKMGKYLIHAGVFQKEQMT